MLHRLGCACIVEKGFFMFGASSWWFFRISIGFLGRRLCDFYLIRPGIWGGVGDLLQKLGFAMPCAPLLIPVDGRNICGAEGRVGEVI